MEKRRMRRMAVGKRRKARAMCTHRNGESGSETGLHDTVRELASVWQNRPTRDDILFDQQRKVVVF
jgi:hypothetical protein